MYSKGKPNLFPKIMKKKRKGEKKKKHKFNKGRVEFLQKNLGNIKKN